MSYDIEKLRAELVRDEGDVRRPYRCTAGHLTVGIGHNLEARDLSDVVVDQIFREDVTAAVVDLNTLVPRWREFDEDRQRVLLNMAFQLGRKGLGGFKRFLEHTNRYLETRDDRELASGVTEMLDSKWAELDCPVRARRLAERWRVKG